MKTYSPANGTEWILFREINCWDDCKFYNHKMEYDRDAKITCPILFKLLDQMGLSEEKFPDVYQFADDELNVEMCPARCLKKEKLWNSQ